MMIGEALMTMHYVTIITDLVIHMCMDHVLVRSAGKLLLRLLHAVHLRVLLHQPLPPKLRLIPKPLQPRLRK